MINHGWTNTELGTAPDRRISGCTDSVTIDGFRLAYRLLCASNLAYGVAGRRGDERLMTITPVLPSSEVIAELLAESELDPASIETYETADGAGFDAFIYGETDTDAVLAFRGTLPLRLTTEPRRIVQTLADWINNANASLIDGRPFSLPGQIHAGFAASLQRLWQPDGGIPAVLPRMRKAIARSKRLFITGHSKGGALATLAALRLASSRDAGVNPAAVVTFAAPRVGDAEFRAAFDRTLMRRVWRYEYRDDIVPLLPPSEAFWQAVLTRLTTADGPGPEEGSPPHLPEHPPSAYPLGAYVSVGQLRFIDWDNHLIERDTVELRNLRRQRLMQSILTALPEVGKAHLPMRGYGYMDFLSARL